MRTARIAAAAAVMALVLLTAACGAADTPSADPASSSAAASDPTPTSSTATPSVAPSPSEPTTTSAAYLDFTDGAIESTAGPKALFFYASWCPQCRTLDDDLRAQGAPDGLTVFKVDFDGRTDLRQKYGVTLQTTVVFVDDAGEIISKAVLYDDPSVASLAAAIP